MATKKISELEAINAAEDNDVLVIVDTSESTTNKITKGNLLIGAGHTIEMTLNENYQIVLVLKNAAGTALSTQTIDLPNENAVTNLAYNNGILTITKQSGATSQINLTGLIEGLVTESDFNTFKEALQATLEAINEKDAEQDEAIAENYKVINKLNEKLENQQKVIDQLPQVEGQGTEVTLENTIEAQFTLFSPEGHSEQETTEGKNKLSFTKNTISYAGVTTNISETKMKFNGKMTSVTNIFNSIREDKAVPAGTYKLSYTKLSGLTSGSGDWAVYFNFYNANGTKIANKNFASNESGTVKDLVLSEDVAYYNYYAYCNSTSLEFNNLELGFMIESGTTATTYEPYTGGIASPNPSYEQPIESAGDNENLFDTSLLPITKNGVTISKDSKGNVVLNGTPTITSGYINFIVSSKKQLSAGTYTASFEQKKVGIGSVIVGWGNAYLNLTLDETINKKTATINDNGEAQFNINVRYDVGTLDNFILNPKLEKGNKASGYSPYGMGSINEKIQTRNWFDVSKISQLIKNGATTTGGITNIANVITINKTNGQHGSYAMNYLMPIKSGKITVSFKALVSGTHSNTGILVALYNSTATIYATTAQTKYASSKDKWLDYSATFELNQEAIDGIHLDIQAANTGNVIQIKDVQVELGSTATPYVPHKEQDYSIFVQQPFRSIGDVRDLFFKNTVDSPYYDENLTLNGWYERHYIGEVVLNGTEEIYLYNDNGSRAVFYINVSDLYDYTNSAEAPELLSNRFRPTSQQATWVPGEISCRIGGRAIFFIFETGTTINDFKNWLSTHNVTVQYLLAEPLDLPCTEEQVEQLENKPSTYKDFTIIQSQDETPAYLEVSGIYDLNKLITRTEVLESEV